MKKRLIVLLFFFSYFLSGTPQNAFALSIIRNFMGGIAATNTSGEGNLVDIFNAAADMWELAILDDHELTLNYGWTTQGHSGTHLLQTQSGMPNRETSGRIYFDNYDYGWNYFMDATPYLSEEYEIYNEIFTDEYGAGQTINNGRWFTGATGDAAGNKDMLSLALHEIGHSLGISLANDSFIDESVDGYIDITAPRPFSGASIDLSSNNYGITSHIGNEVWGRTLMLTSAMGWRVFPSEVDIIVNAEISKFENLDLDPIGEFTALQSVPEPSTIFLLGTSLVFLAFPRTRKRFK